VVTRLVPERLVTRLVPETSRSRRAARGSKVQSAAVVQGESGAPGGVLAWSTERMIFPATGIRWGRLLDVLRHLAPGHQPGVRVGAGCEVAGTGGSFCWTGFGGTTIGGGGACGGLDAQPASITSSSSAWRIAGTLVLAPLRSQHRVRLPRHRWWIRLERRCIS